MNGNRNGISDGDLHAYVDGQLDPDRIAAVESAIAADAELAARVKAYAAQNEQLRAQFGAIVNEPVPSRLRARRIARAGARRRWLAPVAASLVWLAIGLAGGWLARDLLPGGGGDAAEMAALHVADSAVSAHRVYAVEKRHPVEVFAEQEAHLVAWLSKRLGREVRMPDLASLGYNLVGGRLLPAEGGAPAAQFMYEDSVGQRVTIYVALYDSGVETEFRFQEVRGGSAFVWLEPDMGYAIAGDIPREPLLVVGRIVHEAYAAP